MKALLLGLATRIMKYTVESCLAEKTRRMPSRLEKRRPIADSWRGSFAEFQREIATQCAHEHLERQIAELEKEVFSETTVSA